MLGVSVVVVVKGFDANSHLKYSKMGIKQKQVLDVC